MNYEGSSMQNQTGFILIFFAPLAAMYYLNSIVPDHILPVIPAIIGLPGLFNRRRITRFLVQQFNTKYKYSIPR